MAKPGKRLGHGRGELQAGMGALEVYVKGGEAGCKQTEVDKVEVDFQGRW